MTAPAAAGSAEAATCQRLRRARLAYLGLAAAAESVPGRAGRHRAPMAHYPPEHKGGEQAGHKAPTVGRYAASDSRCGQNPRPGDRIPAAIVAVERAKPGPASGLAA